MALLTDYWKYDAFAFLIGFLTLFYFFAKYTYSYWERKGFKSAPDASYILGHFKPTIFQKESLADFMLRIYNSTTEPFIGIYSVFRPILFIRDQELVRSILIKDFNHFTDRAMRYNEEIDPLTGSLASVPGEKWRNLRAKLSPTFSSGKLKSMFSTLIECGSKLENHLEKFTENGQLLNAHDIAACYSTNVIASVAFGIDVDSIENPNNEFRICGRNIFSPSLMVGLRFLLMFTSPKLMDILRMNSFSPSVQKFILSIVKQNLDYREKNNVTRKDFFQLLIQLRNTGEVQLDDEWETVIKSDEKQKTLTLNEMAAHSFIFFAAGHETASSTLTFAMYELANHPDIQARAHEEIDQVLSKHNGEITYESVSEMKYLEAVIDETLRRYALVPMLTRTCVKEYVIPGTNKIIEKGVQVSIPAYALQMDEQYYDEPKKFKPERFLEDGSSGRNLMNKPYLAFGDGPRNCIGMRLGKLQVKVGLVLLLKKFKYELEAKLLNRELKYDPKSFVLVFREPVNLRVLKR